MKPIVTDRHFHDSNMLRPSFHLISHPRHQAAGVIDVRFAPHFTEN
jgi:hypothetical protein